MGVAGASIGVALVLDGLRTSVSTGFNLQAGTNKEELKEKIRKERLAAMTKKNKLIENANMNSQNMFNDKPMYV
jgi:hypothetical protein